MQLLLRPRRLRTDLHLLPLRSATVYQANPTFHQCRPHLPAVVITSQDGPMNQEQYLHPGGKALFMHICSQCNLFLIGGTPACALRQSVTSQLRMPQAWLPHTGHSSSLPLLGVASRLPDPTLLQFLAFQRPYIHPSQLCHFHDGVNNCCLYLHRGSLQKYPYTLP